MTHYLIYYQRLGNSTITKKCVMNLNLFKIKITLIEEKFRIKKNLYKKLGSLLYVLPVVNK